MDVVGEEENPRQDSEKLQKEWPIESENGSTRFKEGRELSKAELSALWPLLPYPVAKAFNKAKRGELAPVSAEELAQKAHIYFTTPAKTK